MAPARRKTTKPKLSPPKAKSPTVPVARWTETLERLMRQVGPPRDLATKLAAEAAALDVVGQGKPLKRWGNLRADVQRVWLVMLVARTRAVKGALGKSSPPPIRAKAQAISCRYPGWAREHRPGHVNGMQAEHEPENGSWVEDARVYWATLGDLLAAEKKPRGKSAEKEQAEVASLEELAGQACSRALSKAEIEELCRLAETTGRSSVVVVQLMSARTQAARTNLMAARGLASPRGARRQQRQEGPAELRMQSSRFSKLPFDITDHAFDRFAERHRPNESLESVAAHLAADAATARPIRERALRGEEQWVSESGVTFVLRRDRAGDPPICVTVLPSHIKPPR